MTGTPFGASWDELTLDDLRDFFAEARLEGLTWEAKSGAVRAEHVRQAVCGFGNSVRGGFLVLGVTQEGREGGWRLGGWTPPAEVDTWIGDCLANGGVEPMPPTDVRSWPLENREWLAIVSVRSVAVPPCMTASGQVFERLSGQTVQVRDPGSLRRLFERGEAALARAAQTADAGRADLAESPPLARQGKLVISVASPSLPGDVAARVFRASTREAIAAVLNGPLATDLLWIQRIGGSVSQHALTLWNMVGGTDNEGYTVRIGRHGSVALSLSDPDLDSGLSLVARGDPRAGRMWTEAAALLELLGVAGPAHVAIRAYDPRVGPTDLDRATSVAPPTMEELESVTRESQRAQGTAAYEPE